MRRTARPSPSSKDRRALPCLRTGALVMRRTAIADGRVPDRRDRANGSHKRRRLRPRRSKSCRTKHLSDGQSVHVSGDGFDPNADIVVFQCQIRSRPRSRALRLRHREERHGRRSTAGTAIGCHRSPNDQHQHTAWSTARLHPARARSPSSTSTPAPTVDDTDLVPAVRAAAARCHHRADVDSGRTKRATCTQPASRRM